MENDKDIKIEFINIKDDKILLREIDKKLPAIYIKESFLSLENIQYYLNMYLNINTSNIKQIKDNYYTFDIEQDVIDNFLYEDIESINDDIIKNTIKELI